MTCPTCHIIIALIQTVQKQHTANTRHCNNKIPYSEFRALFFRTMCLTSRLIWSFTFRIRRTFSSEHMAHSRFNGTVRWRSPSSSDRLLSWSIFWEINSYVKREQGESEKESTVGQCWCGLFSCSVSEWENNWVSEEVGAWVSEACVAKRLCIDNCPHVVVFKS